MTKLSILAFALAACTINYSDDVEPQPDAGGIIPLPCIPQFYPACAAARDAAEAVCSRKERCDELWSTPHDRCVANEMTSLCATSDCDSEAPYDRTQIDACIAEQNATCEVGGCHL